MLETLDSLLLLLFMFAMMLKPLGVVVKSMLAKVVKQGGTAMMEGLVKVEELLLVAMLLPMGLALRGCKEVRQ